MTEEVKCNLELVGKYFFINGKNIEKKSGRYCRSNFWDIKGYGSKKWVVCVRIAIEDTDLFSLYDKDDLVDRCLAHLNKPPPRKKYAKKTPRPKYGVLKHYRSKIVNKDGVRMISALLITDDRKNKMFWGKGKNV